MLEPLFILNYESGEMDPWVGLSFTPNEAQDVWTLKLRPGVAWSDGEAFDADDVVFTIRMLKENAPSLVYSPNIDKWVAAVENVDSHTVRFLLTQPNPRFQLDHFAVKISNSVYIVPEHIWRGKDPLTFKFYDPEKGWPIGTGPYKLDGFTATQFTYVRDDNWWGARTGWKPLPQPERLIWAWYGPEETRSAAMAEGELDSLGDISLGAFQALAWRANDVLSWTDKAPYAWLDPCSRTLEFNHARAPWSDKDLRWAANYVVNRDVIVAIAYEGTTLCSCHFFPAYPPLNRYTDLIEIKGLFKKYPLTKHDPEKAREIIEAKGYRLNNNGYYEKDGQELDMVITTHEAYIEKQRIAQVLVEQFQEFGIKATHRNEAGGAWNDNFQFGNYQARMAWQACGSINEPWASMDTFSARWIEPVGERAQANGWRWNNARYTELVEEIGRLPLNDPQIEPLFLEAMEIWLDELPIIPITQAKKLIPFSERYWTNWPSAKNNYIHPPTWWQSTHALIHQLKPTKPAE